MKKKKKKSYSQYVRIKVSKDSDIKIQKTKKGSIVSYEVDLSLEEI